MHEKSCTIECGEINRATKSINSKLIYTQIHTQKRTHNSFFNSVKISAQQPHYI
jgi:hypothetical protein